MGCILWVVSCGQRPVGSVLWAASCGQRPVPTDEGLEDAQHCTVQQQMSYRLWLPIYKVDQQASHEHDVTFPVSDSPDRQAMSLDEVAENGNVLDEVEKILQDVDECVVYEDQLCQQRCINMPGSYTCACFDGYALQPDGIHCLRVTSEEENGLKEHDSPTIDPSPEKMPTTPPPRLPDPCEGPPQDHHRAGMMWVVDHSQHCSDTDVVVVC
ncbi:hypothetical protein NFI96_001772 [Prochilodus magdalenae]|nr:hypothetical protein NFI96_001772 [Prochilodus magdalenae]